MHTIRDVAKLAGVSIGTVSNVLNNQAKVSEQTAQRVREAIRQLNYTPNSFAKGLKSSQSRLIGILSEDISSFFSGYIIDGICEFCDKKDYSITLCNLGINRKAMHGTRFFYKDLEESPAFKKSVASAVSILSASQICGLIYIGTHPRDVTDILPHLDIPVIYTHAYTHTGAYSINYDDYQGARLAMDYLMENGHTRIALLCGPIDSVPAHKRLLGYQSAFMEHHIQLYPDYIREGDWHYESGYEECRKLLHMEKPPTAIFSMNDNMAYGALNAALDIGCSIPHDVSICGFDNLEHSAYIRPALSTIRLPLRSMGSLAVETLLDVLDGNPPPQSELLLPCVLEERASVISNDLEKEHHAQC